MGSTYLAGVVGLLLLGGIGFIPQLNLAIGYIALMAAGGAVAFAVVGFLASKSIINNRMEAKLTAMTIDAHPNQHVVSTELASVPRASKLKSPRASVTDKAVLHLETNQAASAGTPSASSSQSSALR